MHWRRWLLISVACLPAIALLPSLWSPVPGFQHAGVSLAGYFQTLAIVQDGLASYTYQTPAESSSALHLHSILAAPLFAVGLRAAGRAIALVAAVVSVVLIYSVGARLASERVGLFAATIVWIHPMFMRMGARWWPESTGIMFTLAAMYAVLRSLDATAEGGLASLWYLTGLAALTLGIFNHLWEASIALPMVVGLILHERWRQASGVVLTTIVVIIIVKVIQSFQPAGHDLAESYSVFSNPDALFTLAWLFHNGLSLDASLVEIAVSLTVPLAIFAVTILTWQGFKSQRPNQLILGAWLVSGLTILVLLPRGWLIHDYYIWALLAPLAIVVAAWIARGIEYIDYEIARRTASIMFVVVFLTIAVLSAVHTGGTEASFADYTAVDDNGLQRAGEELAVGGVDNATEVVFVGSWEDYSGNPIDSARVLIYAEIVVKDRQIRGGARSPKFVSSINETRDCKYAVIRNGSNVSVMTCR